MLWSQWRLSTHVHHLWGPALSHVRRLYLLLGIAWMLHHYSLLLLWRHAWRSAGCIHRWRLLVDHLHTARIPTGLLHHHHGLVHTLRHDVICTLLWAWAISAGWHHHLSRHRPWIGVHDLPHRHHLLSATTTLRPALHLRGIGVGHHTSVRHLIAILWTAVHRHTSRRHVTHWWRLLLLL